MIKKMVWERWIDPLGSNRDEFPSFDEPKEDAAGLPTKAPKPIPFLQTPMGPLGLEEQSLASNRMEFWVLHVSFDVTPECIRTVAVVLGVDSVEALSRYRMRIGFPRITGGAPPIFQSNETKARIATALLKSLYEDQDVLLQEFDEDTCKHTIEVRNSLDTKHEFWCLYVLPNGSMEVATSNQLDTQFKDHLQQMNLIQSMVGGVVVTSTLGDN